MTVDYRIRPIPDGVADYFWEEAYRRQELVARLLELFRTWGYADVIPPTFEYAEVLGAQASPELQAEMYRFLDRDGSTLALRPEFTTPVARLVGTRLYDWPMPQRFCYAGSVFRYAEPQAGRQREFWQAGVELIGARSPEADAEILVLTAEALDRVGLHQAHIVLGQMRFLRGLLDHLALEPDQERTLRWALERRSEPALAEFLAQTSLSPHQRRVVERLPLLSGPDPRPILAEASGLCLNPDMEAALADLAAILDVLDGYGVLDRVDVDLTEIRDLGYYTGITFEALTPELGFPVASGGRYDELVRHFGPDAPAVGVAIGVDRVLLALRRSGPPGTGVGPPRPVAPDRYVLTHGDPRALAQVQAWRRAGQRVQVEVNGRDLEAARRYARSVGISVLHEWSGDGFREIPLDEEAQ